MTEGTQEQGQGQIGGSVLSRTIAGKVAEKRPTETGLGTLAGGRRVLSRHQSLPMWQNLLP